MNWHRAKVASWEQSAQFSHGQFARLCRQYILCLYLVCVSSQTTAGRVLLILQDGRSIVVGLLLFFFFIFSLRLTLIM